ncbi:MAG: LysE family translocator, partial [Alphaproteobacteria bacterium]
SIYLIYLAYRIATSASQTKNSQSRARPFSFIQAILFQWINPKGWSMALTGISVYSTSSSLVGVLIITLAYTMINLPCICFWTMLGEQFGRFMTSNLRLRIFNYIMATLLVLTLVQIFFMG